MNTLILRFIALPLAYSALISVRAEPTILVEKSPSVSPSTASQVRTLKRKVAIARFTNETTYGRSFLVDKDSNPIGKQALDILSKKLLDTDKFIL